MTSLRTLTRRASIPLLASMIHGCDTAAVGPPPIAVRDSAGIEIVTSSAPALSGSAAWIIDPTPVLEIGSVDADEPYVFTRVWDATRLPDGRIAVVDELVKEIRLFDSSGQHLRTFGGAGGGPSEFMGPPFVRATEEGTIVAWDGGASRLSWFGADGALLDQVNLQAALSDLSIRPFPNGLVWQVDREGSVLSTGPIRAPSGEGLEERDIRVAVLENHGATSHDLGRFPSSQSYTVRLDRMTIGIGNPYAPTTRATLVPGGRVAFGGEAAWEVRLADRDGTLVRIVRAAIPRRAVTEALVEEAAADARDMAERSPLSLAQAEDAFSHITLPDSVPAVGAISATEEALWVGRRVAHWYEVGDYDVFDADGRWLTTVTLPPEVDRVLEIGGDYILARVTDDLDVQYLRMYRIVRGTASP